MTIEQEFPMVHRFHSREGCGARTLTSTLRLGWEETEPPLNEMALDQTWSLPEGTSRRSHEYETRPWTFLPVKPPSSLWCDSETTMMCGPMNLGIGLPDSKRHEPRRPFPAWSAAGSQFWTRLYTFWMAIPADSRYG